MVSMAGDFVRVMPTLWVLGMAVAALSITITRASVFEAPRGYVAAKSTFFGTLFSCTYCMSHWVSFIVVGIAFDASLTATILLAFIVVFIVKVYTTIIDFVVALTESFHGPKRRSK